jgi:hypothetical protein
MVIVPPFAQVAGIEVGGGVPILRWAFDPNNAVAVSGWGFWFGLLGLVLTLVGFLFTLIQLKATRTAAESAERESRRIKSLIANYDAAQDVSRAQYALKATRNHFSNKAWAHGSETYEDVRMAILAVRDNVPNLDVGLSSQIDLAAEFITKLCAKIDKQIHENGTPVSYVKTREVMREHDRLLVRLSAAVQGGAF